MVRGPLPAFDSRLLTLDSRLRLIHHRLVKPYIAAGCGHNEVAIRRDAQGRRDFGFSILDFGSGAVRCSCCVVRCHRPSPAGTTDHGRLIAACGFLLTAYLPTGVDCQCDRAGVGPRGHDKVILQLPTVLAVIDQIYPWIDVLVLHPAISWHVGAPLLRIIAGQVVALAG